MVMAKSVGNHQTKKQLKVPAKDKKQVDGVDIKIDSKFLNGVKSDQEVPINGLVARVHLKQINIEDYFTSKSKTAQQPVNKVIKRGRGRPRKGLQESIIKTDDPIVKSTKPEDSIIKSKPEQKKAKTINNVNRTKSSSISEKSDVENNSSLQIKKRRRHRSQSSSSRESPSVSRKSLRHHVDDDDDNKDSYNIKSSTARIIKPNPKLQDFVISSGVRYYSPLKIQSKESISPVNKPKVKIFKKSVVNRVLNKLRMENKAKSSSSNDGDVVRSFLPVFDNSSQPYDDDDDEEDMVEEPLVALKKSVKETGNQKSKVKASLVATANDNKAIIGGLANGECTPSRSNIDALKSEASAATIVIPTKVVSTPPSPEMLKQDTTAALAPPLKKKKLETSEIIKVVKTVVEPASKKMNAVSSSPLQKRTRQDANAPTNNLATPLPPQKKQKLEGSDKKPLPSQKKQMLEGSTPNRRVMKKTTAVENTPPKKVTKVNGSIKQSQKPSVRYVLVDSDSARNKNKLPQIEDVDFNKLVRSLKLVKLPASNWKIRIVVSKQQNITEVTFTNKETFERCIKFSRTITGYVITFGKSVVRLLGAPSRISSFNDVSILLDIIHNISPNDPVLEYSTNNQ